MSRSTATASSSALPDGENDFGADVVRVEGREYGKVGRRIKPNPRLEAVA